MPRNLRAFLWLGHVESASFLVLLLVAMPLKYVWGDPLAVRWVGMIHGLLFTAYFLMAIYLADDREWPAKRTAFALASSVLPLGPLFFERHLRRAGELDARD